MAMLSGRSRCRRLRRTALLRDAMRSPRVTWSGVLGAFDRPTVKGFHAVYPPTSRTETIYEVLARAGGRRPWQYLRPIRSNGHRTCVSRQEQGFRRRPELGMGMQEQLEGQRAPRGGPERRELSTRAEELWTAAERDRYLAAVLHERRDRRAVTVQAAVMISTKAG